MSAVTGTDTSTPRGALGPLLAGVRRLMLLGDGASEADAVFRALARELLELQGPLKLNLRSETARSQLLSPTSNNSKRGCPLPSLQATILAIS